jgi:hypothetical protein
MLRRVTIALTITILGLTLVGCGNSAGKAQQSNNAANTSSSTNAQQGATASQDSQPVHLTPIPKGTPLVTANNQVSKQLMTQKDVLGTQIYEQKGIVYGNITFKSGVANNYAHELANEFLTQLKVNYPNRQITTQVIVDGKTTDTISFKP